MLTFPLVHKILNWPLNSGALLQKGQKPSKTNLDLTAFKHRLLK